MRSFIFWNGVTLVDNAGYRGSSGGWVVADSWLESRRLRRPDRHAASASRGALVPTWL